MEPLGKKRRTAAACGCGMTATLWKQKAGADISGAVQTMGAATSVDVAAVSAERSDAAVDGVPAAEEGATTGAEFVLLLKGAALMAEATKTSVETRSRASVKTKRSSEESAKSSEAWVKILRTSRVMRL